MTSKWHQFSSIYSPVAIDKPNTKGGMLRADWNRESGQNSMFINGIALKVYAGQYNGFNTLEDVHDFFREVILEDIPSEKQKEIVAYLDTAFHQGGLMYPVSGAFATSLKEFNKKEGKKVLYATVDAQGMDKMVNIETTPSGFKVQEITGVKSLIAIPDTIGVDMADKEGNYIKPDPGNKYVVTLEGTINIDFTQNAKSPRIIIESNSISYGNENIKSKIDPRHFLQKLIDFFRNILNLNQVEILSSKEKDNDAVEEDTPSDSFRPK